MSPPLGKAPKQTLGMAVERHSLALQAFIKLLDEWLLDLSPCILPNLNLGSAFFFYKVQGLSNSYKPEGSLRLGDSKEVGSLVWGAKEGQFFIREEDLSSNCSAKN